MKKKPLLFITIATLHFIEPLIKILYFKATTPFSYTTILSNIFSISGPKELFEFWLLFPIGGLALMGVKKWSYPVFVGVQVYSIYSHLTYQSFNWPYVSQIPFLSSLALLVINILIIGYFLLPSVREPFFNKGMRWWETKTRFHCHIPCLATLFSQRTAECEILNISETGAFLNVRDFVEIGSMIQLDFKYNEHIIKIDAHIASHHSFNHEKGLGVRFKFNNIWEHLAVRRMIKAIAKDIKNESSDMGHAHSA